MSEARKNHCKQQLAHSRARLRTLLASLSESEWQTPVFTEGDTWTVATVVAHLVDSERGMSIHIHRIRKGEPTLPDGFDLNRWNAGVKKRVGDLSPASLMQKLAETRAKTLEVMDSLSDEDWDKTGRHASRGEITIEQYYETIAAHEVLHTSDIRKALGR